MALTLDILNLLSVQHWAKYYGQEKEKEQNYKKHVQAQETHNVLS